jgi:exonuclease SbcC
MRILSVALRNFKTHQDRFFEFSPGTNAICGENGAGKTSILEAIAWALFDYSPYTTDDMIREGAHSAEVAVAFVSALEDRTYEVRRSTATGYRLYDPQLNQRLEHEKKVDVLKWLRQHLGVPAGTDLPRLFANTIGVPQGTFTADFLKTAQDRKYIFDTILKVEEYQGIYKELLGLQKYSEQQVTAAEHQIELYGVELREWDVLDEKQRELQQAIAADTAALAQVETDLAQNRAEVAGLEAKAQQLAEMERQQQELTHQLEPKSREAERAGQDVIAAQTARQQLQQSEAGFQAFQAAEAALQHLEQQRQARQNLLERREALLDAGRDRQTQLARLQERLERLDQADRQLLELQPLVDRQRQLEAEQKQLAEVAAQLQELQHEQTVIRTRYEAQHQRCQAAAQAVSAAEAACQQQEANRAGHEAFVQAEQELAQLERQQQQRQQAMQQRTDLLEALHRYQVEQATLQEQRQRSHHLAQQIQSLQPQIQQQGEFEQKQATLQTQFQQFQAIRLQRQQRQQDMATLSEAIAALNAKIRDRQTKQPDVERIPALQQQLTRIDRQLARVGAAQQFQQELNAIWQAGSQTLSQHQHQSQQLWQSLQAVVQTYPQLRSHLDPVFPLLQQGGSIAQQVLAQIRQILDDLAAQVAVPQLEQQRQHLQTALQQSYQAQSQWEELPQLQADLQHLQQRAAGLEEAIADLDWQLEAESTCTKQLEELTAQLQELGDPRSRLAILQQESERFANLDRQWQQVQTSLQTYQRQLQQVETDLARSANLSDLLSACQRQRQQFQSAHQQFLKLEEPASSLVNRQQELQQAQQQLQTFQTQLAQWQQQIEALVSERGSLDAISQHQKDVAEALNELHDPRQQVKRLKQDLKDRPTLERQQQQIEAAQKGDRQQLQELERQLKETATVETEIAAQQMQREQHRQHYQCYLTSEPLAKTLPEREATVSQLQVQLKKINQQQTELTQQQAAIASEYDSSRHQELKELQGVAQQQQTRLQVQIQAAQPQLQDVQTKLAQLSETQKQLQAAELERKQRERLKRFIKHIRTVFRDAGPRITELYQRSVNVEADRLFREILNRPNVSLKWEANYDISIQEGGSKKRKFPSLSGGEQMTAALAVRLALLRALADIDIAFFDEPTTNMDRPRRERLAEAIANIKSFRQLFVISHDDTFANITENIIRVERLE